MPGRVEVKTSGPFFSGVMASLMRECVMECDQEVGDHVVEAIKSRLDVVLRHPTGFYRSQIRAHPEGQVVNVDDSGVVYGPWLEGVGTRNPSSSFKGYSTFRMVYAQEQMKAPSVADAIVAKYVSRVS